MRLPILKCAGTRTKAELDTRTMVASGILADVEGGFQPPGEKQDLLVQRRWISGSAFSAGAGSPALRQPKLAAATLRVSSYAR